MKTKKRAKSKKEEFVARVPVYDMEGKVVENMQLDGSIFDGIVNKALLYEVNKMYEANTRKGTACTKTRAEVSGGGSKPWRQKGTGRARFGSSRNPLWRHGGTVFGPKPRDFSYSVPKKAVRKALVSSLNARLGEQMVKAVVRIDIPSSKTRDFKKVLENLKIGGRTLVVVESMTDSVKRSARNIKEVDLKEGRNINARDVLLNDTVLIEKDALVNLVERLR